MPMQNVVINIRLIFNDENKYYLKLFSEECGNKILNFDKINDDAMDKKNYFYFKLKSVKTDSGTLITSCYKIT